MRSQRAPPPDPVHVDPGSKPLAFPRGSRWCPSSHPPESCSTDSRRARLLRWLQAPSRAASACPHWLRETGVVAPAGTTRPPSRHVGAVRSWSPCGQHSSCGAVRGVGSDQGLRPDMMLECPLMWRCCVGSTTSAARGSRWRNSGLWWPRSAMPMSGPTLQAATYCSLRRRGPAALMVRQTRRSGCRDGAGDHRQAWRPFPSGGPVSRATRSLRTGQPVRGTDERETPACGVPAGRTATQPGNLAG